MVIGTEKNKASVKVFFAQKRALKSWEMSIVIIEGNISAGKTTLSKSLSDVLQFDVFFEPASKNPFLERFYQDPQKYAYPMQIFLLKQRFVTYLTSLKKIISGEVKRGIFLDRSVFSDWVFAVKNYRDGNITESEYKEYMRLRDKFMSAIPRPRAVLYLDVSPERCLERILRVRGRSCETGIPVEYLEGLDLAYKELLSDLEKAGTTTIVLDWNEFGSRIEPAIKVLDTIINQEKEEGPIEFDRETLTRLLNDEAFLEDFLEMGNTEYNVEKLRISDDEFDLEAEKMSSVSDISEESCEDSESVKELEGMISKLEREGSTSSLFQRFAGMV